jgi:hypothetical protein
MKDRLQIRLRGPGFDEFMFCRFLVDRTTIGRRIVKNLSSRRRHRLDHSSPTGS